MVKPNVNSVEVHPQLSNNGHPVDGALVGLWFADFGLPNLVCRVACVQKSWAAD
jgi:hypothetical protein